MKQLNWFLTAIIILASLLRLPYLNSHMPSLYGDEIAIGYNAYSIATTGRDEFGQFMPLQFQSWGDQKNPVYIYAVALVQLVTGPTPASVRIPSALAGIVAVYLTYRLVALLKLGQVAALFSALLLALTPWHIHISRGGYEANLALTLGLASVYYLLRNLHLRSLIYLVLACYTYYTTKLFGPALVILVWLWQIYGQPLKSWIKPFARYWALTLILAIPALYLAFFAGGQVRFQNINIFVNETITARVERNRNFFIDPSSLIAKGLENKYTYYFLDFLTNYFDNFSGQFLFVGGDSNLRYGQPNHGMLHLLDAPLIFMGIILVYKKNRKAWLLLMAWLLLAPLPTALVGKAYGLRSLAMLPIPQIFAGYTLAQFYLWSRFSKMRLSLFAIGCLLYSISIVNWTTRYIYQYPTYGRYWYDSAVKEAIDYAKAREADYDHFIISNAYGKTDIYFAYYEKIDPVDYIASQKESLIIDGVPATRIGKYYFADLRPNGRSPEKLDLPANSLVIGDPLFPFGDEYIYGLDDGRVLFRIYKNNVSSMLNNDLE